MFAELCLILGQVVGYIPQYREIRNTRNTTGFSPLVSFILLVANILRLFFWYGKRFDPALAAQSAVMIFAQFVLLELIVRCRRQGIGGVWHATADKQPEHVLADLEWKYFWNWDTFSSYVGFIALFSALLSSLSFFFLEEDWFVEILGFLALGIEATLAVPQWYRNFKNKSTAGFSFFLVFSWFVGDAFKTAYFWFKSSPAQFLMCGSFQLVLDVLIFLQFVLYRGSKIHPSSAGYDKDKPAYELRAPLLTTSHSRSSDSPMVSQPVPAPREQPRAF